MALASNPHVTSSPASNVKATPARIEVSVKKAGTDSYVTVLALATGHAPVREVKMCFCLFSCVIVIKLLWSEVDMCGLRYC